MLTFKPLGRTWWLIEVLYSNKRMVWFIGSKESWLQKNQGSDSRDVAQNAVKGSLEPRKIACKKKGLYMRKERYKSFLGNYDRQTVKPIDRPID